MVKAVETYKLVPCIKVKTSEILREELDHTAQMHIPENKQLDGTEKTSAARAAAGGGVNFT